jgi:hypothetical protein
MLLDLQLDQLQSQGEPMLATFIRERIAARGVLSILIGQVVGSCCILWIGMTPVGGQEAFMTVDGDLKNIALWALADFHPFTTEVRGIPVGKIRNSWCEATEFRKELIPKELLFEGGVDAMEASKLSFALEGHFDGTATKQVALVGVYQVCSGQKGRFILILDQSRNGQPKVRFVNVLPTAHQFGVLSLDKDGSIVAWTCMDCDNRSVLKWDPQKRRFAWTPDSDEE